jgi:hypothetical protein
MPRAYGGQIVRLNRGVDADRRYGLLLTLSTVTRTAVNSWVCSPGSVLRGRRLPFTLACGVRVMDSIRDLLRVVPVRSGGGQCLAQRGSSVIHHQRLPSIDPGLGRALVPVTKR